MMTTVAVCSGGGGPRYRGLRSRTSMARRASADVQQSGRGLRIGVHEAGRGLRQARRQRRQGVGSGDDDHSRRDRQRADGLARHQRQDVENGLDLMRGVIDRDEAPVISLTSAPVEGPDKAQAPFVSLYSTASAGEDFAELMAWRELSSRFETPLKIQVLDARGVAIVSVEPLKSPAVRLRLEAAEAALARAHAESPEKI